MLQLDNISVSYGAVRALEDASLALQPGEIHALLGPSGCGKTTLLRAVAGFERVVHGQIMVGETLCDAPGVWVPPEKRSVGIVFQDYALFSHLNVRKNVGFSLTRHEGARIDDELARVELAHCGARMPAELSGGQQQRVALARALASRPSVLLLDEPFSNLDPGLRESLRQSTRRLVKEHGVTTLLVTHDADEAMSLADRITVMHEGHLLQSGTPETLYVSPISLTVARALGPVNPLNAWRDSDGGWHCAFGELVEATSSARGESNEGLALLRPEMLRVIEPSPAALSRQEGVASVARVADIRFFGATCRVELESESGERAMLVAPSGFASRLQVGATVGVRIDPGCVIVPR